MTELDARVFRLLHEALSHSPAVLFVMAALTVLGSGWSMLALVPLLVRARTRAFALALTLTLSGTSLLVFVVKHLSHRLRPCASLQGVHALVFAPPTDFSFPSGHAAGSFAFAAFVAVLLLARRQGTGPSDRSERSQPRLRTWLAALGVLALAAGVALSRVALGVHFPGDVAFGALVGLSTGAAGGLWYVRRTAVAPEDNRALP